MHKKYLHPTREYVDTVINIKNKNEEQVLKELENMIFNNKFNR